MEVKVFNKLFQDHHHVIVTIESLLSFFIPIRNHPSNKNFIPIPDSSEIVGERGIKFSSEKVIKSFIEGNE